jgi:hypothetical protein
MGVGGLRCIPPPLAALFGDRFGKKHVAFKRYDPQ